MFELLFGTLLISFVLLRKFRHASMCWSEDERLQVDLTIASSRKRVFPRRIKGLRPNKVFAAWIHGRVHCSWNVRSRFSIVFCPEFDSVILSLGQSSLSIAFDKPLLGVSPGQAVVLYDKSWCLGGGTIQQTITLADNLVTVPGLPTC